jgi:uncharacterized membrane protein YkvA (DUF1232 family)
MTFNELLALAIQEIEAIDFEHAVPILKDYNLRVNKPVIKQLQQDINAQAQKGKPEEANRLTIGQLAQIIATEQIKCIQGLPGMVNKICTVINNPNCDPAAKVSLTGVLAYFISPNDIIPDDQPGAIGYIDDAFIMFAVAKEFLPLLQPTKVTEAELSGSLNFLFLGIPPDRVNDATTKLNQLWQAYHMLKNTPPFMINMILQQLLNNPLMLGALLNQSVYQNMQIPATPFGASYPNLNLTGLGGSMPVDDTHLFPGGGGWGHTDSGFVVWD